MRFSALLSACGLACLFVAQTITQTTGQTPRQTTSQTSAQTTGAAPGQKPSQAPAAATAPTTGSRKPDALPKLPGGSARASAAPLRKPKLLEATSGGTAGVVTGPQPAKLQVRPAEAAYRAKLRAMLAPVLAIKPSEAAAAQLKDALKGRSADGLTDPLAAKLVRWQVLKAGIGAPDDFVRFAKDNPSWPDAQVMRRRAEEQLLTGGGNSQTIRAFFGNAEPTGGAGWAALASAALAEGDEGKARQFAAKAWTEFDMSASLEPGFLERFGKLLGPAEHKRRLDRILVDRLRFKAERRERAALARRVIKLLPEGDRQLAETRLSVFLKDKAAGRRLASMPLGTGGKTDWGLAYAHAAAHLDAKRLDAAARILRDLPTDAGQLVSPDDWWLLRREAAYLALKAGKPQLAYDLVSQVTPLSENPAKEQAHMAGWIAIGLLKKPKLALRHFQAHLAAADGPLSRARANYWLGRAFEALGRKADARARYKDATRDQDTFHALLARQKLQPGRAIDLPIKAPALPNAAQLEAFLRLDSVQAAVLANRTGLARNMFVGLMAATRNYLDSEPQLALLAELASALGDPQTSLRIGKAAIAKGYNLIIYAYPLDSYPAFKPLGIPPETALMLAVARQETEFNHSIVSTAGARGLLQVMPVTARHVCRDHRIACDIPRLLTDDAYNAMISAAYIGDRMRELGGWYVVSLAAYNAGPGRARQWIRENGDPRTPAVDAIDWIERIPIEETRGYVQKVLSNIQIYRARLGEPNPLRLVEDLHTPTGTARAAAD